MNRCTALASGLAGTLALIASACGTTTAQTVDDAPVFALDRNVAAEIQPVDPDRTDVLAATDLRLALQGLLTEHATLSNEAMRSAVDGAGLDATLVELTRNTDALTLAIGLVYGPEGASAFDQLWTNHIEFFNNYGEALRSGDAAELESIRAELDHYETDFSDFVAVATGGNLDFHTVLHVLHSHVNQLLDQAEAWADDDFATAAAAADEAFIHMDTIAAALATGISVQQPDAFPGDVTEAAATSCAAAHLVVSHAITGAAEVAFARSSGNADRIDVFETSQAQLTNSAADALDTEAATALADRLDQLSASIESPADRSAALAEVAAFTTSVC